MTPLPVNPRIVILIEEGGNPRRVASNIAPLPEMEVIVTDNPHEFAEQALGKPFNQAVPQQPDFSHPSMERLSG